MVSTSTRDNPPFPLSDPLSDTSMVVQVHNSSSNHLFSLLSVCRLPSYSVYRCVPFARGRHHHFVDGFFHELNDLSYRVNLELLRWMGVLEPTGWYPFHGGWKKLWNLRVPATVRVFGWRLATAYRLSSCSVPSSGSGYDSAKYMFDVQFWPHSMISPRAPEMSGPALPPTTASVPQITTRRKIVWFCCKKNITRG